MRRHGLALALVAAAILSMPAASAADESRSLPVLESLTGSWEGGGTVMGMDSAITAQWEWRLQNRFLRLTFSNRMTGADGGGRLFEGVAFYQVTGPGTARGTWMDTNGNLHPIEAVAADRSLTSTWGVPGEHHGRTVYTIQEDGSLEIVDWIQGKSGEWKEFGRSRLSRRK